MSGVVLPGNACTVNPVNYGEDLSWPGDFGVKRATAIPNPNPNKSQVSRVWAFRIEKEDEGESVVLSVLSAKLRERPTRRFVDQ